MEEFWEVDEDGVEHIWRTDPCGKCGRPIKWDMNDKSDECPNCGSEGWMYEDTDPSGCFDLAINPLH